MTLGLGGIRRHACVAIAIDGRLAGACEQERLTRVRAAGPNGSGLPDEAIDAVLRARRLVRADIGLVATAEPWNLETLDVPRSAVEHHLGHAATAYLTSPFEAAVILVCDHEAPQVTVWTGEGADVRKMDWDWHGPGHQAIYARAATALGFVGGGQGQHLEAFARLNPASRARDVDALFGYAPNCIPTATDWADRLAALGGQSVEQKTLVAASLQNRLADLVLALLADVRKQTGGSQLCLGGSLFYNSHLCSQVKSRGPFDDVFVPVNPGNAGLAVGSALSAAGSAPDAASPFLGPSFDAEEIKATLDNCKLSYEWAGDHGALARAVDALMAGKLVGWFDGAMEWGPRALGARSILANPFAPFVLENLNRFLKHREPWRGYAVSCLEHAVPEAFEGPRSAPHMECDYLPRDRERFRHVVPRPEAALRVHGVGQGAPRRFRDLLEAFGQATGLPALVNTSFNGFQEPIVCSPRDAIRVYYGTGLDMLVIDRFVLEK